LRVFVFIHQTSLWKLQLFLEFSKSWKKWPRKIDDRKHQGKARKLEIFVIFYPQRSTLEVNLLKSFPTVLGLFHTAMERAKFMRSRTGIIQV
jgi:hypothetical protein